MLSFPLPLTANPRCYPSKTSRKNPPLFEGHPTVAITHPWTSNAPTYRSPSPSIHPSHHVTGDRLEVPHPPRWPRNVPARRHRAEWKTSLPNSPGSKGDLGNPRRKKLGKNRGGRLGLGLSWIFFVRNITLDILNGYSLGVCAGDTRSETFRV